MRSGGRRRWFRLPVTDRDLSERDVDAELAAHIEARVERLIAHGMPEAEARALADQQLGGAPARYALKREAWERDSWLSVRERIRSWGDDVRYALRALRRAPGYTTVIVITLALGIGANVTMFGLVDRLLLSGPAHVEAPEQLHRFYVTTYPESAPPETFSPMNGPVLFAMREQVTSLDLISGYMDHRVTLGSGAAARPLELGGVSASFFDLTGARPHLGRFFDATEDTPAAGERVIVISHAFWQSELGGRTDALGESLVLSGQPWTIIGVAPAGFTGVELKPKDGWVPLATAAEASMGQQWDTRWRGFWLTISGRLRPGFTPERAAAEATAAWRSVAPDWPAFNEATVRITSIRAGPDGEETMEARIARWLMAVAAVVLLVASANVANLYFARGLSRRREIGVRLALGVSRRRLVRLFFVESMMLALLGGIAALAVAWWGAELVRAVLVPDIDWTTSPLNQRVLAVATAITVLVGVVTGLAPAIMSSSTRLAPALAGSAGAPPAPGRARGVLAVLQAAFCVVLLIGAGVFVRSLWNVYRMDLGMDADRVLSMWVEWETPGDLTPEQRAVLGERRRTRLVEAAETVASVPGVESASLAIGGPFGGGFGVAVRVDGIDSIPSLPGGGPFISAVGPDFFVAMGTPLLRGRAFQRGEGAGTDPVVIVNRTTADQLWPGADPLGRCVYINTSEVPTCSRVVGVVADMRRSRIAAEEAAMQFYVPFGQQPSWMGGMRILARTSVRPAAAVEPLRQTLHSLEPSFRYVRIQPFSDILDPQRRPWKLGAVLFALCGLLALSIAGIGLYSVIAYQVAHRRHEIGVRMALGAERGTVVGMVLRQAVSLAVIGVAIGVVAAVIAAPHIEPLLFETAARDTAVFGATAGILVLIGLTGGALPAWRASRVPPTEALRDG